MPKKTDELDISIPTTKASRKTMTVEHITNNDLHKQLVELNQNMVKLHSLLYSSDWKLWKTMNIIEMIARENGYTFETQGDNPPEQVLEKEAVK